MAALVWGGCKTRTPRFFAPSAWGKVRKLELPVLASLVMGDITPAALAVHVARRRK